MTEEVKKVWESKTFWVNLISILALLAQTQVGFIIPPEAQAALLAVINVGLRAITKQPIAWK